MAIAKIGLRLSTSLTNVALSCGVALLPAYALSQEAEQEIQLNEIVLNEDEQLTVLGDPDDANATGTITLGEEAIVIRGDLSSDPNAVLRSLPNVQYQNDLNDDAGENNDDVLNLQPLEVSISGARVDDNNFMIDGIGINSVTGTTDPYSSSPASLSRRDRAFRVFSVYGLHSQSVFVPKDLLEVVEVQDSNVSAEYGGFQGGVVNYKLKKPVVGEDFQTFRLKFTSSDLTSYDLGTENDDNPLDRDKPEWTKYDLTYTANKTISSDTALLFALSRESASSSKQMEPEFVQRDIDSVSNKDTISVALRHQVDDTSTFDLEVIANNTDFGWNSTYADNQSMDVVNRGTLIKGEYEKSFDSLTFGGQELRNVVWNIKGAVKDTAIENDSNTNIAYSWSGFAARSGFLTTHFRDWCTPVTSSFFSTCNTGATGDTEYNTTEFDLGTKIEGDIWAGKFKLGLDTKSSRAERIGSGFVFNSSTTRAGETRRGVTNPSTFICPEGADDCVSDQYFSTRVSQRAYAIEAQAKAYALYGELQQEVGAFDLRGGLRVDYNDYLKNLDIAPRLSATWKVSNNFALTAGANRYFTDNYLSYAIHDQLPRTSVSVRSHDDSGNVGEWSDLRELVPYSYDQSDVKTPFNDEFTLAATFAENWTNGTWRIKGVHRDGRDQFSRSSDSSSTSNYLTNDGRSKYTSVSVEYQKQWEMAQSSILDQIGVYVSATHADRGVSNETLFGSAGEIGLDEYIWYNGRSYTESEFQQVSGNLDIPVRATLEVATSLRDEKVKLGVGANINFGYTAVRDTDENELHTHSSGITARHDVYEDFDFDPTVTTYLNAAFELAEVNGNPVNLNLKVDNLLNDTGQATATSRNPWKRGRAISFELSHQF